VKPLHNAADIFRRFLYSRLPRRTLALGYFSTANTRTTPLSNSIGANSRYWDTLAWAYAPSMAAA
jgi:hypothetical protein